MLDTQEIVEMFELLGDWEERYRFLVEMGEQMSPMPVALKTDGNKVQGCVSEVWVRLIPVSPGDAALTLAGDSETAIIKGVVAVIAALCTNKTAEQILDTDFDQLFEDLALADHLSPNRHVGIYSIVNKICGQARALASAAA